MIFFPFLTVNILAQETMQTPLKRLEWYMKQRMYPHDSIPLHGYYDALEQKSDLRNTRGLYLSEYDWESIGPQPGYYTGFGDISGRVQFVEYDPEYAGTIYVGAANGGVWKTTNYGENWLCITKDIECLASGAFAIDASTTPHILYYGTGEKVFTHEYAYYGLGLFKSTNEGQSWTWIQGSEAGLPELTYFFRIVINPTNNQHLLAALGTKDWIQQSQKPGIYRSTDGGLHWTCLISNLMCTDITFSPSGDRAYAVGPRASLNGTEYRISEDGGMTFGQPQNNIFQCEGRSHIAICKNHPEYIYIATRNSNSPYTTLALSTNRGYSFSNITLTDNFMYTDGYGNYAFSLDVSPDNPGIIFVSLSNLWLSTNYGVEFFRKGGYNTSIHPDFHGVAFDPTEMNYQKITAVSDGGVYRSDNLGNAWINLNTNLNITQFYRIASNPYNSDNVYGGTQDNGLQKKQSSPSIRWDYIWGGDFSPICFQTVTLDNLIGANSWGSKEIFTTNNGINWNWCGMPTNVVSWITPVTSHPTELLTFFTTRTSVWKTADGGSTWSQISSFNNNSNLDAFQISSKNPNYMYTASGSHLELPWVVNELYRTTNNTLSWSDMNIHDEPNAVPIRYITNIGIDPANPNEVLLALSGFSEAGNPGTVFRSTDGGENWFNVSGNPNDGGLPDNPINDIIIYYSDCNTKNYIAATDVGVYLSSDGGSYWIELSDGIPNTACLDLDYNRLNQKLFLGTHGMGAYKLDLGGLNNENPIIIKDNLPIGASVNINYDIVVCSGGKLIIPNPCTISFAEGKRIIVQDGGQIDASSGVVINLTSSSSWGGIEFQDGGWGTISNAVFSNTSTPITITSTGSEYPNGILIKESIFNNGSVLMSGRNNVTITKCTTNTAPLTAISAVYSPNLVLSQNEIYDSQIGISVSNSSPVILSNRIINPSSIGISLDNCYSGTVNYNYIQDCPQAFYYLYSSPTMLENTAQNDNASGVLTAALYAELFSSPRLKPSSSGLETIWDAGKNILKTNNTGSGIYMYNLSFPNVDYGYNTIYGSDWHLDGWIGDPWAPIWTYYARNNCWIDEVLRENIIDADVMYIPYTCEDPPGGGGIDFSLKTVTSSDKEPKSDEVTDLQPIIINYGNGIYDTLRVTNQNIPQSADWTLISEASKLEIAGNFQQALAKYQQVVQNYRDSSSSILALKKILYCHDKMHAPNSVYSTLRTYYNNLAGTYSYDTGFVKEVTELSSKCLVRLEEYPDAITRYENVIMNSEDSLEILCSELNIIETYMIMQSGSGSAPSFTGELRDLKPINVKDGFRMIQEKLGRIITKTTILSIPNEFRLMPNYPNPFNPVTIIKYEIPKSVKVTLKVYDILGRLVRTLVNNEQKEPGRYEVTFDATGLASGIYFYTIEAGEFKQSRKMVLVR